MQPLEIPLEDDVLSILRQAEPVVKEREPIHLLPAWPEPLAPEAFHGLAGETVSIIEPHSEADPVALLMHLLVAFGNLVGRSAHFVVGGTTHHGNLYCVNVGATASRKGSAKDDAFFAIRSVDENWFTTRIQSGLSSGEGFIWAVRDAIEERQPIKEKGRVIDYQTVVTDEGVQDKRLLLVEPEFGSVLRMIERDGNTLSAQIRQAWDSGTLRILTKNKAARATDTHISILGHITRDELLKYLNETEQANGFANRILWAAVRRSKFLPDGGKLHRLDLDGIVDRLCRAAQFGRAVGEVSRSESAGEIWREVYPKLAGERIGLLGAVTARAEAQTMRLAMLYALLDCSPLIEPVHLMAALAVWQYAEDSARFIFGDALGDGTADVVLKALRNAPDGLTRTELSGLFGRHKPVTDLNRALTMLAQHSLVRQEKSDNTGGRPTERWFVSRGYSEKSEFAKKAEGGDVHE